jgi:hypothetical protein
MAQELGKVNTDSRGNLTGASFAFAGMNFMVDPADLPIESGMCVDICNCDIDSFQNVSRRNGSTLVVAGNITSAWANELYSYCVRGNRLCSFDGIAVTQISNSPVVASVVEFKQVNDVVAFSDGTTVGVLNGDAVTVFAAPQEFDTLSVPVATYVTTNLPTALGATPNMSTDIFSVNTSAGICLEFFNGRLYYAIDNFVYCTKAFDIGHCDIRYNVVAGFGSDVTMIARVTDGLFVGTGSATYFLKGMGPYEKDTDAEGFLYGFVGGGFVQSQVSKYGVVYGTQVRHETSLVIGNAAKETTVMWSSPIGVVSGVFGGALTYMSLSQITMSYGNFGTAMIRQDQGYYQYIVAFNGDSSIINASSAASIDYDVEVATWVLNTTTGGHSRFSGYAFNSFFQFNGIYYGANVRGIFSLTGDLDYDGDISLGAYIDAFVLTPVTDFNEQKKKQVSDAYINARADGNINLDIFVNEDANPRRCAWNYQNIDGIYRKRTTTPRGLAATSWQFKISNDNGCYFKLFDFEVSAKKLKRTI